MRALVLAALALTACQETQHCPPNNAYQNGECRRWDASATTDTGSDTSIDAGADGGPCAACGAAMVCSDSRDAGVDAGPPTCVPCVTDDQCAPVPIDAGTDGGGGDAGALLGHAICENFHCRAGCRSASDCRSNLCLADHTCSAYGRHAQGQCERCDTQENCAVMLGCIETFFGTMPATDGYHCMAPMTGPCTGPYLTGMPRTSLDGTMAFYCLPTESLTTCEAVLAIVNGNSCGAAMDCASRGADCQELGGGSLRCTYRCGSTSQCPLGYRCPTGFCHQ